jgi:hypothetical protein
MNQKVRAQSHDEIKIGASVEEGDDGQWQVNHTSSKPQIDTGVYKKKRSGPLEADRDASY